MTKSAIPQHHQAEKLREQDKFLEALKLYEEVILSYQSTKDYSNLIEALCGRSLTYKHLFLQTNDLVFALLSKSDIQTAILISNDHQQGDTKYKLLFNFAETEMLFKNYPSAIENFQKAINQYPNDNAEKGRYYDHLGEAQYHNGDQQNGLENLKLGLDTIRRFRNSTDSFLINVWETGCLMKLFNFSQDKKYLIEAKKIIDSDPRLIIRRRQIAKLSENL